MEVEINSTDVKVVLSFLESLVINKCSTTMISNYVLAIKACFVLYDLPYHLLDHPKVKLLQKSIRINRPLADRFHCAEVLRAVFLNAFFGFF